MTLQIFLSWSFLNKTKEIFKFIKWHNYAGDIMVTKKENTNIGDNIDRNEVKVFVTKGAVDTVKYIKQVISSHKEAFVLFLRAADGGLMIYPQVEIARVEGSGEEPFYYEVYCYGIGDGARGEFGVKILFDKEGKMSIKPYPKGYQGDDADTYRSYRYDTTIKREGDGSLSIFPDKYERATDAEKNPPVIKIFKEGVQVANVFVPFTKIPHQTLYKDLKSTERP